MKTINRNTIIASALFLMLWTSQTASGWYDSNLQRWLNRDPIGERGGRNLYGYVGNNAITGWDSFGLVFGCSAAPDPCEDPCGDAKRKGYDGGDYGGVVCCGGKKYTCVWKPGETTNKKAQEIAAMCIRSHERKHFDDTYPCPKSGGVTRPHFRPGVDDEKAECSAYQRQLACLNDNLNRCGGDSACEQDVRGEIARVERRIRETCGGRQ